MHEIKRLVTIFIGPKFASHNNVNVDSIALIQHLDLTRQYNHHDHAKLVRCLIYT